MQREYCTPGGFRVTGAWSKAGFATCVRVTGERSKQEDVLFDLGTLNDESDSGKILGDEQTQRRYYELRMHVDSESRKILGDEQTQRRYYELINLRTGIVLISHGHVDHVGSCIQHARARARAFPQATYYLPADCVDAMQRAKAAFEEMDGHPIPMKIVGISPGQSIQLSPRLRVVAFPTTHRVPSLGFALYLRRSTGLKPEYAGLSDQEIVALRRQRVAVSDEKESLEVVYTGDTSFDGLLQPSLSFVFTAPLLIAELTYLDGSLEPAVKYGHVHLQDVVEHAHRFQNEYVVFFHVSVRYKASAIRRMLEQALPADLVRRCGVTLHSFGYREYVTQLRAPLEQHEHGFGHGKRVETEREFDADEESQFEAATKSSDEHDTHKRDKRRKQQRKPSR